MSFTDLHFPYGPFCPHHIPRQYIESYFSWHQTDQSLVLNTTVEDVSLVDRRLGTWRLTLRKSEGSQDYWWQEELDALIIANGHYSVPYVPSVPGLEAYTARFPNRVEHSKVYRNPRDYAGQKVIVIGNSASGHDVMTQLRESRLCQSPIYVSRRSRSRWDGDKPPDGIEWVAMIQRYDAETGDIHFVDGTVLKDVDKVIYSTGYKASFPFWNSTNNGRPLFDYLEDRLIRNYQHTFLTDFPTLAIVGMPRVLTFRSFEYQSVAVARLWAQRTKGLPSVADQKLWLEKRAAKTRAARRRFHQIEWDEGEAMDWFRYLYDLAGLPLLEGSGRVPPVLDSKTRWTIDHVKKYPDYGIPKKDEVEDEGWDMVQASNKDSLWYL